MMPDTPDATTPGPGGRGEDPARPVLTPERLLQLGMGFWPATTLLSAVELGVCTRLADGPLDAPTLTEALGLHPRSALDFLDALVALQVLERDDGKYRNAPDTVFRHQVDLPVAADIPYLCKILRVGSR